MSYDHENEDLWHDLFFEPPASLFREVGESPKEDSGDRYSALENRLNTLENRLDRTLQCLNRCQTDQAALRKDLRGLAWEQDTGRKRVDGLRKNLRLGLWTALGLALLGWLPQLAEGGRKLLDTIANLLEVDPALTAGAAVAVVLLALAVRLGRILVDRLARRREGRDEDALSDR